MKKKNYYRNFLKHHNDAKCPFPWVIDPYGCGCSGGCSYCYAKPLLSLTGNWLIEPQYADMKRVRNAIQNHFNEGDVVRLGSLSDPMQPIEDKYNVTEMTIEALIERGVHHLIVTKYARVADDRILKVYDKRLSHFQITLTSTDDEMAKEYEGGSSVTKRIEAIEKLQSLGLDISIRLSPFIPEFVDNGYLDIRKFNEIRCNKVLVEFLRMSRQTEEAFGNYVVKSRYSFEYRRNKHLPLTEKCRYIEMLLSSKPEGKLYSFTDVVPEHFAYISEHYNINKHDCCNLRL